MTTYLLIETISQWSNYFWTSVKSRSQVGQYWRLTGSCVDLIMPLSSIVSVIGQRDEQPRQSTLTAVIYRACSPPPCSGGEWAVRKHILQLTWPVFTPTSSVLLFFPLPSFTAPTSIVFSLWFGRGEQCVVRGKIKSMQQSSGKAVFTLCHDCWLNLYLCMHKYTVSFALLIYFLKQKCQFSHPRCTWNCSLYMNFVYYRSRKLWCWQLSTV